MRSLKKTVALILALIMSLGLLCACRNIDKDLIDDIVDIITQTDEPTSAPSDKPTSAPTGETAKIDKNGSYTTKEDVALYLYTYGELPQNFITKKEAEDLGWTGGGLEKYAPGKCIGGTYFGNYENKLPAKAGREYHECDIDTLGASSRGAKRIVYSNDGLIYYTGDHYETFELLYGEE